MLLPSQMENGKKFYQSRGGYFMEVDFSLFATNRETLVPYVCTSALLKIELLNS